ncbi:flagellar protein FlgN [Chitiniphilus purpureus]|uniref:Flagellar protein FlgN n=1 Tax=Chitiniphilus purpureus TaxID=2981137 RepID=A0ABY6DTL5_9NEIS|nr:flagellar protein FlgN [Chitiniphilus sp. CD1]UXY17078.1 flagellar protein FlgN [Chitiniphilus sp. CD1]
MTEAAKAQFIALFSALESTMARFDALLEEEQHVLVHSDIDSLSALTAAKLDISNQLENQFQALRTVAQGSGVPLTPAHLLDETLRALDPQLAEQWQRIRALSQLVKARNASNGQLIETRRHLNDRLFAELSQTQEVPQLYGEDGRVHTRIGGQPFDKA